MNEETMKLVKNLQIQSEINAIDRIRWKCKDIKEVWEICTKELEELNRLQKENIYDNYVPK